jgi:hypothetical protein
MYAHNGFADDKNNFFHNIFMTISNWGTETILGGDFNVTMTEADRFR